MSDKLDRQAARERCEKATPGPWTRDVQNEWNDYCIWGPAPEQFLANVGTLEIHTNGKLQAIFDATEDNAEFIAHARSDLPLAIAELDAQDAMIAPQAVEIARLNNREQAHLIALDMVDSLQDQRDKLQGQIATLTAQAQNMREAIENAQHGRLCKKYQCGCDGLEHNNALCRDCPCDCWKSAVLAQVSASPRKTEVCTHPLCSCEFRCESEKVSASPKAGCSRIPCAREDRMTDQEIEAVVADKRLRHEMRSNGWSLELADQRIRSTSKESCIQPEGKYKAVWWDGGCVEGAAFADTEDLAVERAARNALEQGAGHRAAAGKDVGVVGASPQAQEPTP